jgi:crossover junction endodeoxyribonuclease RusA
MTFAMVIPLKPVSIQRKRGTQSYARHLQREAAARFAGRAMLSGDLYARIIWFHSERAGDIDNIIKPILDALTGVIYPDDHRVVKCSSERIDMASDYELSDVNVVPEVFEELVALLAQNHAHIMYIEVGQIVTRRVVFGPIDGGDRP